MGTKSSVMPIPSKELRPKDGENLAANSAHPKRAEGDLVGQVGIEVFLTGKAKGKIGKARVKYVCDLCEREIHVPFEKAHITKEHVVLCPACHKYITAIPEGITKECVMNFLSGNVI